MRREYLGQGRLKSSQVIVKEGDALCPDLHLGIVFFLYLRPGTVCTETCYRMVHRMVEVVRCSLCGPASLHGGRRLPATECSRGLKGIVPGDVDGFVVCEGCDAKLTFECLAALVE